MKYAREDTHYLLYIYDKLKNDLIDADNGQTNLISTVISRSTLLCAKVWNTVCDWALSVYGSLKYRFSELLLFEKGVGLDVII